MHKQHNSRQKTAAGEKTKRPARPKEEKTTGEGQERFAPQTELGRRLWRIRQRIVASGQPLLGWDEIEKELRARRGDRGTEA